MPVKTRRTRAALPSPRSSSRTCCRSPAATMSSCVSLFSLDCGFSFPCTKYARSHRGYAFYYADDGPPRVTNPGLFRCSCRQVRIPACMLRPRGNKDSPNTIFLCTTTLPRCSVSAIQSRTFFHFHPASLFPSSSHTRANTQPAALPRCVLLGPKLYAEPSAIQYIRNNFDISNVVIVSPDAGGAKRCVSQLLSYRGCRRRVLVLAVLARICRRSDGDASRQHTHSRQAGLTRGRALLLFSLVL